MIKIFTTALSVVFAAVSLVNAKPIYSEAHHQETGNLSSCYIEKDLMYSAEVSEAILTPNALTKSKDTRSRIRISSDKTEAELQMNYNDEDISVILCGQAERILADNGVCGYYGTYEGEIYITDNGELFDVRRHRRINVDECHKHTIIADITFTESDMFASISFSCGSGMHDYDFFFYGDITENIEAVLNKISENLPDTSETANYSYGSFERDHESAPIDGGRSVGNGSTV